MNNLQLQSPLSEQLRDRIGKRRVRLAVFFTYMFDPGFFGDRSHPDPLRSRLEPQPPRGARASRGCITQGRASGRLLRFAGNTRDRVVCDPRLPPLRPQPSRWRVPSENILLLLEEEDEAQKSSSLLLVTTSANLTQAGWWENLEAAHMIEIPENSKSLLRDDLLSDTGLLSRVVKHDKTGDEHRAVEEIRKFLRYRTERSGQRSQNGVLRPRIYVGQMPLARFLLEDVQIDPILRSRPILRQAPGTLNLPFSSRPRQRGTGWTGGCYRSRTPSCLAPLKIQRQTSWSNLHATTSRSVTTGKAILSPTTGFLIAAHPERLRYATRPSLRS